MTDSSSRRSFLSRLSAAASVLGLGSVAASEATEVQPAAPTTFRPTRHAKDDWFDLLPGQHRMFFDAVSPAGAGDAIAYATNFLNANASGYGLEDKDVAAVICLRHIATPFAFNDAIWTKYGAAITGMTKFNDPKTAQAPVINLYNAAGGGRGLGNRGTTLDACIKRGVHFAVCDLATHAFARTAAGPDGDAEAVYKEFVANAIPNAHFVAAGILGVNRAQERGYSIAYVG